ncbi:MAG TPA: hypothetical protein VJ825_15135 [Gemmatimonadaceae bacterium]|nr:hypothetical protein [Gemmatimonadaceae bacterium]
MYSTCIFCKTSLGTNEAIEHFPVGRRLAFDAAKGRLWVVCRKCERWNLTPLEERWEAIEECERFYRGTKLRTSTDQIGLARLGEGLELVRIGKPLRPEFAAWRYGDQFGARRRKFVTRVAAGMVLGGTIPIIGPALGLSLGGGGYLIFNAASLANDFYRRSRVVARLQAEDGRLLTVRRHDATETMMLPPTGDEPWGLRIQHYARPDLDIPWWQYAPDSDTTDIRGDDAIQAAAQVLPHVNHNGASAGVVQAAVVIATESTDSRGTFSDAAHLAVRNRTWKNFGKHGKLAKMPEEMRLALEMISHEESERRALEGELHILEEAWREAEEIAAISDDMFLPEDVSRRLAEMKGE